LLPAKRPRARRARRRPRGPATPPARWRPGRRKRAARSPA
jgi:hypothetical protein